MTVKTNLTDADIGVTVAAAGSGGSLPSGLICMWGGLVSAIPSGWLLCDGTSGTPDLRSKFVKGSAPGVDPGATGGASIHSHTYTDIVNHTHVINVTDPGHTHTQNATTYQLQVQGGTTASTTGTSIMTSAATGGSLRTAASTTVSKADTEQSQTTSVTATSSNPAGSVASGTTATSSSEPAWYGLCYIMKS